MDAGERRKEWHTLEIYEVTLNIEPTRGAFTKGAVEFFMNLFLLFWFGVYPRRGARVLEHPSRGRASPLPRKEEKGCHCSGCTASLFFSFLEKSVLRYYFCTSNG